MNTAFYSGLAGLSAYSGALNVVGNNLANINTSGFKFSDVSFEDLVTRTFGGVANNAAGNPMQVGLGILPNSISGVFSQWFIQTTTDSTNAALEGNGFFVVGDTVDDRFYTRAGNFFLTMMDTWSTRQVNMSWDIRKGMPIMILSHPALCP